MAERRLESVSDVLLRVVRGLAIEEKVRSHAIEPAWPRAVGARVAASTRPVQLRSGMLVVEARSAAWLNEASMLREQIRVQLNREMGGDYVREVRFRLGGGFPPLAPPKPASRVEASEADVAGSQKELAAEAGDEGARLAARARALHRRVKLADPG